VKRRGDKNEDKPRSRLVGRYLPIAIMQATPPPLPFAAGSSSVSNAWKEAVQRYLDRLSEKQKTQFMAAATPQDCLTIIEKARYKRRKTEQLLAFLQPIIEPLKRFEGTIDVVVQINTGITSPIWGPLRMGITVGLGSSLRSNGQWLTKFFDRLPASTTGRSRAWSR
jgi:hypothetical protein